MIPFLDNKFMRYGLFGLGAVVVLAIGWTIITSVFTGFSGQSYNKVDYGTQGLSDIYMNEVAMEESYVQSAPTASRAAFDGDAAELAYYPEPPLVPPTPDGYTTGLERFETSSYNISARTRQFDELCDTLQSLKAEADIHFKHISESLNHCDARFFVEEDRVAGVLAQFGNFRDIEINRNTQSVTRHKEQIESRTTIVQAQLSSVEKTLAEAEVAYDEIVAFARANREAQVLSDAIDKKLRQIDTLTQRKISLVSQLDNYAQQATDLNERLGVVEFYASFNRAYPIDYDDSTYKWERAWELLKDRVTDTLTGVTVLFGVFLLYTVQYGLYLLALVVIARFGWKLVKKIWAL